MENNQFLKVRIKNWTCYYFDDITKLECFDLDNILIDEKSHKNILTYDISDNTLIDPTLLRIRFNLISQKSGTTHIFSHYFMKIKLDSYDSLPIEKRLTLYNVTIHIKSVLNKDKNHYYYEIFLEKCLYQLTKK